MINLKAKKTPRASKKTKRYEEKLFVWFTISIFILILIALIVFFINKVDRKNVEKDVVALVNDQEITADELDNWYTISIMPEYRDIVKKEDFLVNSLIPQKILVQEAEKNDVKVSNEEVETALGQFLIDSGLSLNDFEKKLKDDGTDLYTAKKAFKQRLMINKFLNQTLFSKITVSDSEVDEIYKNTKAFDPSLTANEIKQIIREQLTMRKQNEALQSYIKILMNNSKIKLSINNKKVISFSETGDEICKEGSKPIIRLYTTSWCTHCKWIKNRFDDVIGDYLGKDEIVAYHWELDTGDNTLTKGIENGIPKQEIEIFKKYNPKATVPTYIFGCRYLRVGNFYEESGNLDAEEEEFRAVIEKLLQS